MARLAFWRKSDATPARELTPQELADRRHRRGWFSYAFASEAFVVVSMTLFMPVALEQYARENGRATPDLVDPCPSSTTNSDSDCKVRLAGRWTNTTSFSLYTSAASMGLQLVVVISMSALADRPYYRKSLLLGFAWLGALATIVYIALPSSSSAWPLAMPLTILANVGFGASFVALNAYLPGIASRLPEVREAAKREGLTETGSQQEKTHTIVPADIQAPAAMDTTDEEKALDASATNLPAAPTGLTYNRILSRAMARTSAHAIALGYSAGIILLLVTLIPVIMLEASLLSLRIAILMSGVWWATGTILTLFWLRGEEESTKGSRPNILKEIARGWQELFSMIRPSEIRRMKHTFRFLLAWFLLSDGLSTITATAILFARTELHMASRWLIILGALSPAAGIVGTLVWPIIQRKLNLTTRTMIVTIVLLASLLPLYGCIGIPLSRKGVHGGGLTASGEMFGAAIYFGLLYGAFQSFARSQYGEIIPPDEEARWYALYSITDKSSSFVGPLIVGAISDGTGNIRWGFLFLLGMILLAVPVVLSVDVKRARADARAYRRPS